MNRSNVKSSLRDVAPILRLGGPSPRLASIGLVALALFAALCIPLACVTDKVTGEKKFAPFAWSEEQEQQIGDEAAPNFEQQFGGAWPDAQDQQYLGSVVKEMATHSVRKDDFEYQFEVLNSSEPNAFALPGGYVYITRGLLQNLGSEGEFVAILGHELGHVEHQHSMLQQNKTIAATVLLGLVGVSENLLQKDPDDPDHVSALASFATPLALLHYSRSQESESDERGLFFAHSMGYDPREMKKTFEYFQRLEAQSGSETPEFLRSHPTNQQRIEDIDRIIAEKYSDALAKQPSQFRAPPTGSDRFVAIVSGLRKDAAAYQKHDQALALLAQAGDSGDGKRKLAQARKLCEEAQRQLPDEPLIECLAGEIQFTEGGGDRGRAHFERSRSLQQSRMRGNEYWKPAFYLGAIDTDAGKPRQAVPSLRKATALFPDNPVAHYYLARAQEKSGDARGASHSYTRVTQLTPNGSSLHQRAASRLANTTTAQK